MTFPNLGKRNLCITTSALIIRSERPRFLCALILLTHAMPRRFARRLSISASCWAQLRTVRRVESNGIKHNVLGIAPNDYTVDTGARVKSIQESLCKVLFSFLLCISHGDGGKWRLDRMNMNGNAHLSKPVQWETKIMQTHSFLVGMWMRTSLPGQKYRGRVLFESCLWWDD
jgi:hypothetical protein